MNEQWRPAGPPDAGRGDLPRERLVQLLAGRWDVTATCLVAGAGFGKTTALAQAVQANASAPRGVDAWVACEPGDEDSRQLGRAVLAALGARGHHANPAAAILAALRACSPARVCIILDDVHLLPDDSSSVRLLGQIVPRLPANAHLVIAGRRLPPLPLTRLRADGQVTDIDAGVLAFTEREAQALCDGLGLPAERLSGLGGWPALVRLALSAPAGATGRYVWEEVVSQLPPGDRRALLALAVLGAGDEPTVASVAGQPVDLVDLAARTPLVSLDPAGVARAHDMWQEGIVAAFAPGERDAFRRTAVRTLLQRGDHVKAGSLAARHGDVDGLRSAALSLVLATLDMLPVDTARLWLAGVGEHDRQSPELLLLQAATDNARWYRDPHVVPLIDAARQGFAAATNPFGEAVAIALATRVAHARGDVPGLERLAGEAAALRAVVELPGLELLAGTIDAATAELRGDVPGALAALDRIGAAVVPGRFNEAVDRLSATLLILAGHADEAVRVADALLTQSPNGHVRQLPRLARWLAGDPTGFEAWNFAHVDPDITDRDRFRVAAWSTVLAASWGQPEAVEHFWDRLQRVVATEPDNRDRAAVVCAAVARLVGQHDEAAAAALLAECAAEGLLDDPAFVVNLTRFLALVHICHPAVRACWKPAMLGPSHLRLRAIGDAMVAARAGELSPHASLGAAPAVFCALPLPWSVELAARAEAAGNPAGRTLGRELVDRAGDAALAELAWLEAHGDGVAAAGARSLAAGLGLAQPVVGIDVLGPLRVSIDGVVQDRAELRRRRVRELLAVLVAEPDTTRARLQDLLWPDHGGPTGARNFRVTLTHLRRALDTGGPPHHQCLRTESARVVLSAGAGLRVDLWEFESHLARAKAAYQQSDMVSRVHHLTAATALWRGDPLLELDAFPDLAPTAARARLAFVDAALTLGELRLTDDAGDEALDLVARAIRTDPYSERAHRLLVALHLQRGDRQQAANAGATLREFLDEMGIAPEPATEAVMRNVDRLGALARPSSSG